MGDTVKVVDSLTDPAPDDPVSFIVVCQPLSGRTLADFRKRLTLDTLRDYLPAEEVRAQVAGQLKRRGFEVFDHPSPVVSARGSVRRLRSVFEADLVRLTRRITTPDSEYSQTAIVPRPGSEPLSPRTIEGALFIVIMAPPRFGAPAIPPANPDFNLRVPGDVAQLTRASAAHRLLTPAGEQSTGRGVTVAIVDTGFSKHRYYEDHAYRITRLAAPDTSAPDVDDEPHGTFILASLLACAPDVNAYGIKMGGNPVLALDLAMTLPQLGVISISWVYDLPGVTTLPLDLVPLRLRILATIAAGVMVIAAAGNGEAAAFPAMMPEVIAVGGVEVTKADGLRAWSGASSFTSSIYAGRNVPDVCGLAPRMLLPVPGKSPSWQSMSGGTSSAAPQVAGIAALLLQKNPALGPEDVRKAIRATARDVKAGTTATNDKAKAGTDRATGAGLVDAAKAWQLV